MADNSSKFPYIILSNLTADAPENSKQTAVNQSNTNQLSTNIVRPGNSDLQTRKIQERIALRTKLSHQVKQLNRLKLTQSNDNTTNSNPPCMNNGSTTSAPLQSVHSTSADPVPWNCQMESKASDSSSLSELTKSTVEALSTMFPHQPPINNVSTISNNKSKIELPSKSENAKHSKTKLGPSLEKNSANEHNLSGDIDALSGKLKAAFDKLVVHVKNKDMEILELKQQLIELQLVGLRNRKDMATSKDDIERLNNDVVSLQEKITSLETMLCTQDETLIKNFLAMDPGDGELSDSEFDMSQRFGPPFFQSHCGSSLPSKATDALDSLQECNNWIPIAPDFDKLMNIISMVNFRTERSQSLKFTQHGNEATFKPLESLQLTLYKNGLILGSEFRSYSTLSVIKLINELFKGSIPSELQSKYANGVVFLVNDKRTVNYDYRPSFDGSGVKLGDSKSLPSLIPLGKKMVVQKSQELGVGQHLKEESTIITLQTSPEKLEKTIVLPNLGTQISHSKMVILKIKDIFHARTYKLKLPICTTIEEIHRALQPHITTEHENGDGDANKCPSFEIVNPVPQGILSSQSSTLEDYGIVSNTVLFLKIGGVAEIPTS